MWLDVVLWHLWDRTDCPVLILRGAESDLLSAHTVELMLGRGSAAGAGKVFAAEFAGCGHAPALMDCDQIAVIEDFIFPIPALVPGGIKRRAPALRTAEKRPS